MQMLHPGAFVEELAKINQLNALLVLELELIIQIGWTMFLLIGPQSLR